MLLFTIRYEAYFCGFCTNTTDLISPGKFHAYMPLFLCSFSNFRYIIAVNFPLHWYIHCFNSGITSRIRTTDVTVVRERFLCQFIIENSAINTQTNFQQSLGQSEIRAFYFITLLTIALLRTFQIMHLHTVLSYSLFVFCVVNRIALWDVKSCWCPCCKIH